MKALRPKCKTCNKPLKKVTQDLRNQKEPYKGNLICIRTKKILVEGWSMPQHNIHPGDTIYYYTLWDGESYRLFYGKKFCGRHCAAMYAVRRLS